MLPSHSDLTYFLEVAARRNISRAAERLGITQPSLSVALVRLERAVGTELLIRRKSGVQLTRAGLRLAERSRDLLQDWSALRTEILSSVHEISGRFTLGCHVSLGLYLLPEFLPALLARHPRLEFVLEHDLSRRVTERVISHQLDFGLVVNPVSHPDLVVQELCTDRVSLWSRDASLGDTLIHDPALQQGQTLLLMLDRQGVRFPRTVTSSSLEVILELCSAGLGTAILPARVARGARRRLHPAGAGLPQVKDRICLIYRPEARKTAAPRAVIEAIRSIKLA